LQGTGSERHLILPRLTAGVPLLGIGLVHVLDGQSRMEPLVAAAGLPFPPLVAPIAVACEIAAGAALLLGAFARVGALLAIPTLVVAIYAHLTIGVWPNGADREPPLALPVVVLACAVYVLWRGAGRWSVDERAGTSRTDSRQTGAAAGLAA
jgi:uncharacterized membrane protein YphA (DoxX/SURF4 family)